MFSSEVWRAITDTWNDKVAIAGKMEGVFIVFALIILIIAACLETSEKHARAYKVLAGLGTSLLLFICIFMMWGSSSCGR